MNLAHKIDSIPTVHGLNCTSCGNPWWFDRGGIFECTTCAAQVAPPPPNPIPARPEPTWVDEPDTTELPDGGGQRTVKES